VEGAAKRLRPKFMTMATTFVGLIPIMWATGSGSDVWKRVAAPMVGGIFTSFVLEHRALSGVSLRCSTSWILDHLIFTTARSDWVVDLCGVSRFRERF
jgi:Cu/Ag efflux pump CusA